MKRILCLLVLLIGFSSKAQVGYTVVSAPALEATQSTMAGIQAGMQASLLTLESIERTREQLDKLTGWVTTMQSAKKLFEMIQTLSCLVVDFEINLKLIDQRMYCGLSQEIQMVLNSLELVVDLTNFVLSSFTMTRAERMAHFEKVFSKFVDIQLRINHLNYNLVQIITDEEAKQYARNDIDILIGIELTGRKR